ncbi:MAG: hypothetical protein LBR74_09380 [Eubacterium sp.]|jgi:hypothetical protein|nr:hypothetical protein [Eubacterium sp.]
MTEFLTWDILVTYGGSLAAVMMLTQFTKGLNFIKSIPTQVWSYVLTLVVLYPAQFFTGVLNLESAVLTIFNGVIISLAANGSYNLGQRVFVSKNSKDEGSQGDL